MNDSQQAHIDLQVMARQISLEHGFEPDFPSTVQQQLADIKARPPLASLFQESARPDMERRVPTRRFQIQGIKASICPERGSPAVAECRYVRRGD